MRGVAPFLPVKVDLDITPAPACCWWGASATGRPVLRLEALQGGPRLQQRAIDGEVVRREQVAAFGLVAHGDEELAHGVVFQQPRTVLAERAGVERRVGDVEV